MSKTITWAALQAYEIQSQLAFTYGRGFEQLSDAQRDALLAERVIFLLRNQQAEQYAPAIKLIESVLTELGHHSFVQVDA
jgi:hypothetical protein